MLHRPLVALAMAGALCSILPAHASPPAAQTQFEPKEVRAWLMRIHDAASHRNFRGTFVVTSNGAVSSAHIVHYCDGANQFERIDALDGETRHVFRHNDVVHTLWPQSHTALVEQRDQLTSFPALLQLGDDRIGDFYAVQSLGMERMAGHEANVLLLRPRDGFRFGYRLWADHDSGLLLRSDVLGEHGEILESSAFSDVEIGVPSQPDTVTQPMSKLDGYRVVHPTLVPTELAAEGWSLRRSVPGFHQVRCLKRPLDGSQEGEQGGKGSDVVQTIYSDGLTYVSVFIEPYDAELHNHAMLTAIGATQTLMRRHGDWWITVVGDVPVATLKLFAGGLERKP